MILNLQEYREKVLGCWMGKNIGGTLGAPLEWLRQVNHVDFYTQELGGEPLPNDDLDIQLLWVVALEEQGIDIDAHTLAEYWVLHVTPHWGEYGTAKINMRSGLVPPLSGMLNNPYKDSCGSFIRSEIWACLAPGFPHIAARYAYQDAILDHGDGEGVYGEVFCGAMESAAFVEKDIPMLLEIGLSYIPAECGVARAVREMISCHRSGKTWLEARRILLAGYRGFCAQCSAEDAAAGFGSGQRGWDVPSNIGIVVIGLLYGEDDFARTLCTAVNCGEDTDCTAATVGAIWGIRHGLGAIPSNWIQPIGRKIKIGTLNLGEFGRRLPADIDNLTERTIRLAQQMVLRRRLPVEFSSDRATDVSDRKGDKLMSGAMASSLYQNMGRPVFRFPEFEIALDYGGDPTIREGTPKTITVHILNIYKIQANLNIRWRLPEGWRILPNRTGMIHSSPASGGYGHQVVEFRLEADKVEPVTHRMVLEVAIDSRPTVMLVPVTLLSGNIPSTDV